MRLVAVEGAKGFGLPLTRRLLAAGKEVVDVPTHLTADGRGSSRSRGKDDPADAITIARIALREPALPKLRESHLAADLKLLVDARDQLVGEATRVRNRLHALLLTLAPGYRAETGALSNRSGLRTARRLVRQGHPEDPIRARLALAAANQLLAICGVGPIVAAKIFGETHDVGRFPSAAAFAAHAGVAPLPASSGTINRHRLNRGGNRQLNRALFTIAMVQAAGIRRGAPISPANGLRERALPRRGAA